MSKILLIHKDSVSTLDAVSNLKLEVLQKHVGGYIESYPLFSNFDAIFNDEGLLRDMEKSKVGPYVFRGPVIIAKTIGDSWAGLSYLEIIYLKNALRID